MLTNPAMPGLVKIGKTGRNSVDPRLSELYSTGVPVPFDCEFACSVEDETIVEKAFHTAFGPYRVNPKREFFEIEPDQAITLLRLMMLEDKTPQIQEEAEKVDSGSQSGSDRLRKRRPRFNFFEMGIPQGSTLQFISGSGGETVTTNGEKRVLHGNDEFSLTAITKDLLGIDYNVAPGPHWTYEGRTMREIYNDTYESS